MYYLYGSLIIISENNIRIGEIAMTCFVECLPSNSAARIPFPARSGILIFMLGLAVCRLSVLSCVVSGSGPDTKYKDLFLLLLLLLLFWTTNGKSSLIESARFGVSFNSWTRNTS